MLTWNDLETAAQCAETAETTEAEKRYTVTANISENGETVDFSDAVYAVLSGGTYPTTEKGWQSFAKELETFIGTRRVTAQYCKDAHFHTMLQMMPSTTFPHGSFVQCPAHFDIFSGDEKREVMQMAQIMDAADTVRQYCYVVEFCGHWYAVLDKNGWMVKHDMLACDRDSRTAKPCIKTRKNHAASRVKLMIAASDHIALYCIDNYFQTIREYDFTHDKRMRLAQIAEAAVLLAYGVAVEDAVIHATNQASGGCKSVTKEADIPATKCEVKFFSGGAKVIHT